MTAKLPPFWAAGNTRYDKVLAVDAPHTRSCTLLVASLVDLSQTVMISNLFRDIPKIAPVARPVTYPNFYTIIAGRQGTVCLYVASA